MIPSQSTNAVSDVPVSVRIVERVARREGTGPVELDRQLDDVIDPDALDALVRFRGTNGTIEFGHPGYRIVVRGDGQIEVAARSPARRS